MATWSVVQQALAVSSGESEFYAAGTAAAHGIELQNLLDEMSMHVTVAVLSDSSAAIGMCSRLGVGRVRHLEVRHLWIQGYVKEGRVILKEIGTRENCGDIGTKAVPRDAWLLLLPILGMELVDG